MEVYIFQRWSTWEGEAQVFLSIPSKNLDTLAFPIKLAQHTFLFVLALATACFFPNIQDLFVCLVNIFGKTRRDLIHFKSFYHVLTGSKDSFVPKTSHILKPHFDKRKGMTFTKRWLAPTCLFFRGRKTEAFCKIYTYSWKSNFKIFKHYNSPPSGGLPQKEVTRILRISSVKTHGVLKAQKSLGNSCVSIVLGVRILDSTSFFGWIILL